MLNNKVEYERMAKADNSMWWYCCLHELVLRAIIKNDFTSNSKILDIGCGTGGLLFFLKNHSFNNISGIDISEYAVSFAKGRELNVSRCSLQDAHIHFPHNRYDVLCVNDVLYFIDRADVLNSISKLSFLLRSQGLLIMNLPVFEAFSGIHDISVGCVQRFSRQDVKAISNMSGFVCVEFLYWPFFLSPIIYFSRLFQRIKLKSFKFCSIESDVNCIPSFINKPLYWLSKLENKFLNQKPFGSSAFIVLRKL